MGKLNSLESQKLVFSSTAMKKVLNLASKTALADSPVLITGKSGVGKELTARFIHDKSARKLKPFMVINGQALSSTLMESELFGHVKGAFTGAHQDKTGLLESANGGTIVFDEIGGLEPALQTKLLRVLQEKEIYKVGSLKPIHLDIRVICLSAKNLAEEVIQGHFREDLYYRINTIMFTIPPLSERTEDIKPLLKHFLDKNIQSQAMDILVKYAWPGNVRELKNLSERLKILHPEKESVSKEDLPPEYEEGRRFLKNPYTPGLTLAEVNRLYILSALKQTSSKREAAKSLGITVKTLYNRLHEYGVFDKYAVHPAGQSLEF